MWSVTRCSLALILLIALLVPAPAGAQGRPGVTVTGDGGILTVIPNASFDHLTLSVATPDGQVFVTEGPGGPLSLNLFGIPNYTPPDGSYVWEARSTPRGMLDSQLRARAQDARESGQVGPEHEFRLALNRSIIVQSGAFQIVGGTMIMGGGVEPQKRPKGPSGSSRSPFTPAAAEDEHFVPVDQVIPDDLIVQGSACIGLDCVNNESFGFDTIRLKENNTRIKFEDTSVSAGFPANDWQLTANDSASGGLNKFSIEDITGAKVPFTVVAGAATNSIFVDSTGRVGFRTSTPVMDLHVSTSNTPALRLEQNTSGGFTAQTWDVGGNEANFFVRDVTGGSRLSFRIRPGAPTSSLDIASNGSVGIGTGSPNGMQVNVAVAEAARGVDNVRIGVLAGTPRIILEDSTFTQWEIDNSGGRLRIFNPGVERFTITGSGDVGINCNAPTADLTIASGTGCTNPASSINAGAANFTVSSSRTIKENLDAVRVPDILDKVAGVGVFTFDFVNGPKDRIGFVAEEFHRVFGRGSDKVIAGDEVQVALWLAVQQLIVRSRELQQENAKLREEIEAIKVSQPLYSRHRKD